MISPVRTFSLFYLLGMTLTAAEPPAEPPTPPEGYEAEFDKFSEKRPWFLSPEKIAELEGSGRKGKNYREEKVNSYVLPELFRGADGAEVKTAEDWAKRREELLGLFKSEVYGEAPPRPEGLSFELVSANPAALGGTATQKRIAIRFPLGGEIFTFHLELFIPNQRGGPSPLFLLLNHRDAVVPDAEASGSSDYWPVAYGISRGYAMGLINTGAEVDPDTRDSTGGVRQFYRKHHPQAETFTWATLGAWAWSASRAVDYLETDSDVDSKRIAVIGHSRSGKTALWAGAQDERFALVCPNNAGEGGPALTRRNFGETLKMITTNFPYWFTPAYAAYADQVDSLPVDMHELIALVAPRGYHGGDGELDLHADPRGAWLALVEASKAWALPGAAETIEDEMPMLNDLLVDGPIAYHIREGGHALGLFDWKLYFDHADSLFETQPR